MKETIIEKIKGIVDAAGGELILAMDGITLETCNEEYDDNLIVTELITKFGGLHGNTTWGIIDLEETITDEDDWYSLDDIVTDSTVFTCSRGWTYIDNIRMDEDKWWYVGEFTEGRLWMNNCDGEMVLKTPSEILLYTRF